nr:hypothetical protein [Leifsonia xyli]
MPAHEARVGALQEPAPLRLARIGLVDEERGEGVVRRLDQPGSLHRGRAGDAVAVPEGRAGDAVAVPEGRAGGVAVVVPGVEDDLRQSAVAPLGAEDGVQLLLRPAG